MLDIHFMCILEMMMKTVHVHLDLIALHWHKLLLDNICEFLFTLWSVITCKCNYNLCVEILIAASSHLQT
jgi:hypothetical protein